MTTKPMTETAPTITGEMGRSPRTVGGMPLHILLREALEVATFFEKHWEPAEDRRGLKDAGPRLPENTGSEITALVEAVRGAQARYLDLLAHDLNPTELSERGERLLDELTAVLDRKSVV